MTAVFIPHIQEPIAQMSLAQLFSRLITLPHAMRPMESRDLGNACCYVGSSNKWVCSAVLWRKIKVKTPHMSVINVLAGRATTAACRPSSVLKLDSTMYFRVDLRRRFEACMPKVITEARGLVSNVYLDTLIA